MTRVAALALLAALASGAAPAHEEHGPAAPAPAAQPRFEPPPPGSYELPPFGRVAEHALLGPDGQPAGLPGPAAGGATLVSFVYLSCPDACPLATAVLQRVDRAVAEDPRLAGRVQLATVSFDPARDTPERMAALAHALSPRGRWRFLTAPDAAAIEPVLDDYGQDALREVAGADGESVPVAHVLKVFLIDGERRVRNVYSSQFLDARVLLNDLLTVLAE